jgi:heme/copper-type cytochrome/quinol oxidase subunit 3
MKLFWLSENFKNRATELASNSEIGKKEQHAFHILGLSKLPMFIGTLVGLLALTFITKLQYTSDFSQLSITSWVISSLYPSYFVSTMGVDTEVDIKLLTIFLALLIVLWSWARELTVEATYQGHHTAQVQSGLKLGVLLFLLSEAMLFFPFFWAFFHGTLSPSIALGGVWPGVGVDVEVLNPFLLPFVNTVVLLSSGLALVSAHRAILAGYKRVVMNSLFISILFGILFSWLQYLEYGLTLFTITDGLYGSSFFLLTGLHGFHVIVGTCLLLISYWRVTQDHFTRNHHIGFEAAAWYWHFVDVVWLGVFSCVYFWAVTSWL